MCLQMISDAQLNKTTKKLHTHTYTFKKLIEKKKSARALWMMMNNSNKKKTYVMKGQERKKDI
jgi:hypothetical protein